MYFALTHPALPSPILIGDEEHGIIVDALLAKESHVVLDTRILPMGGLGVVPHEEYVAAYQRKLKPERRRLCTWGNVHQFEDTGDHDHCKRDLDPTSPLVAPKMLSVVESPKVALPAA